jgi:O-antigen/teichoic acid export membrane protein
MLLVRIGSSLAVNKLFAYFFGAGGITILSHLQNLFSIMTLVPAEGVGKGLVKYIADTSLNQRVRNVFLLAGLTWHLILWLLGGLFLLLFADRFFFIFPPGWSVFQWLFITVSALLGQLIFLYSSALLLGLQKIKTYLISQIGASALVLGMVIIGVSTQNLSLAILCFVAGQGLSIFMVFLFKTSSISANNVFWNFWRYVQVHLSLQRQFKQAFVALGKYSLMALSVVLFGKTVDFFVRQFAVDEFGLEATGLWQAVVRTSDLYTQIFTALLGIVYFPKVAAIIHQKAATRNLIKQTISVWLPLIMLGLACIYVARHQILYLLFDKQFLSGAVYFQWQLLGDFFIMISYFFAYVLLGKARIRLFILLQAISAGLYVIAVFFLYKHIGIEGLPVANFIRSAGYAICLIIFTAKDL